MGLSTHYLLAFLSLPLLTPLLFPIPMLLPMLYYHHNHLSKEVGCWSTNGWLGAELAVLEALAAAASLSCCSRYSRLSLSATYATSRLASFLDLHRFSPAYSSSPSFRKHLKQGSSSGPYFFQIKVCSSYNNTRIVRTNYFFENK
jgi:hypothetical protein